MYFVRNVPNDDKLVRAREYVQLAGVRCVCVCVCGCDVGGCTSRVCDFLCMCVCVISWRICSDIFAQLQSQPNILFLLVDAISRRNFFRKLPLTAAALQQVPLGGGVPGCGGSVCMHGQRVRASE